MALESGIQLKESGIPVSNDGNTVQTRIQDCRGLPLRGDHASIWSDYYLVTYLRHFFWTTK